MKDYIESTLVGFQVNVVGTEFAVGFLFSTQEKAETWVAKQSNPSSFEIVPAFYTRKEK